VQGVGVEVPRRRMGGGQGWVDAGLLWAPKLHGSACGVPPKPMEGLARPERHRWRPIATAANSPEMVSRLNSGMRKGEGRG
jgi:hypothetical protein